MSTPTPPNLSHEDGPRAPYTEMPPYAPHTYPQPQAVPPPPLPTTPPPRRTNTGMIIAIVAIVVLVPLVLCVAGALLAAGLGIFTASRQVERSAESQFQFAVPNHPTITISDTAGEVTITSSSTQQVTVTATKRARALGSESATNLLNTITVTAEPTADGARITATTGGSQGLNQQSVDLRIAVPATSDLSVTVNAGTISIRSIAGKVNVTNNAGTVDAREMTIQGASSFNVSTGTLRFEGALASDATVTATVNTGNATIQLPRESATHIDATTRVGSINVSPWTPTIQQSGVGRSTAFDLNSQPTSTMTVRVDVGEITIRGS